MTHRSASTNSHQPSLTICLKRNRLLDEFSCFSSTDKFLLRKRSLLPSQIHETQFDYSGPNMHAYRRDDALVGGFSTSHILMNPYTVNRGRISTTAQSAALYWHTHLFAWDVRVTRQQDGRSHQTTMIVQPEVFRTATYGSNPAPAPCTHATLYQSSYCSFLMACKDSLADNSFKDLSNGLGQVKLLTHRIAKQLGLRVPDEQSLADPGAPSKNSRFLRQF